MRGKTEREKSQIMIKKKEKLKREKSLKKKERKCVMVDRKGSTSDKPGIGSHSCGKSKHVTCYYCLCIAPVVIAYGAPRPVDVNQDCSLICCLSGIMESDWALESVSLRAGYSVKLS